MAMLLEQFARRHSCNRILAIAAALVVAAHTAGWAQMKSSSNWVIPTRFTDRVNPLPATPQNVAAGEVIYLRMCSPCHGWTGNNDGPKAPKEMSRARRHNDPSLLNETDGTLFYMISEGLAPMPSTHGVLTDEERWQVIIYMRTLTAKPKP